MPSLALWALFLESSSWFSGPSSGTSTSTGGGSTSGGPVGPYGAGPLIQAGLPVRDVTLPRM